MATVPGVDSDDDVAPSSLFIRCAFYRPDVALLVQVDDQAFAIVVVGTGEETAGPDLLVEIEHHAKLSIGAYAGADRADCTAFRQFPQRVGQAAVFEVDDEPVGAAQGKDVVRGGTAEIEHDTGAAVLRP